MIREIRHPERLILSVEGTTHYGYDQDWYPTKRQRIAGCGPTTAAAMMAYTEHKEWQIPTNTKEEVLYRMLRLWQYATPRLHGLYKTVWMRDGLERYMKDKGLVGEAQALPVSICSFLRPDGEKVCRFLRDGLESDCPVGFLNLHSGGAPLPYAWHWMLLVRLEERGDDAFATVWDEGKEWTFSVKRWVKETKLGGGFVRVMGTGRQFD